MASEAFREQEEEAKAALAAAELVPVLEEREGDMVLEGGVGAQEWLGGPDPGSSGGVAQERERLPLSPDKRTLAPLTPEEMHRGVKVELDWRRGRRLLPAWNGGWLGAACPCGLVHSHSGEPGWEEPPPLAHGRAPPLGVPSHRLFLRLSSRFPSSFPLSFPLPPLPPLPREGGEDPKGLSRTAAWRTGQPCSPRPDAPGPSPGTSTVGLVPACFPGPGRGDCPLDACRRSGTLEESGRRQAPPPTPALLALVLRRMSPGGCFAGTGLRGRLACGTVPRATPRELQTRGSLSSSFPEPPLTHWLTHQWGARSHGSEGAVARRPPPQQARRQRGAEGSGGREARWVPYGGLRHSRAGTPVGAPPPPLDQRRC